MFKQGISVPGLTLLYLFNDLPEKTYFTIFNEKNKDLHELVKDNICGGPSIIFHRYHEKGVTTLRQNEYGEAARPCRSIVGYDANALYLVVAHARHADGMVHATTGFENDFRGRIGAAVRTDGFGMVDVGIRTNGTLHTTSDQRTREENRQTSGGWVVQRDEDGLSVPRLFLPRLLRALEKR